MSFPSAATVAKIREENCHMADQQSTDQPKPPRTKKSGCFWITAFVVGLVLIDVIGIGLAKFLPWLQMMTGGPGGHRGVGQTITFLKLTPLTGNPPPLAASDLQGRVTLLNFWGTWCPPCRAELPHMNELHKHFAGQAAVRLVAISYPPGGFGGDLKSLAEETASLLKELNLDLPTYCDPDSETLAAVDRLIGFEGFPTTLLVDRRGVIRKIWVGYGPGVEKEMKENVGKLLAETEENDSGGKR